MIQRIQTLYLLAAAIFMGLMFVFPMATFLGDEQQFRLMAAGLEAVDNPAEGIIVRTLPMTILLSIAVLLPAVTIFLFKRRTLQIRLCFAEMCVLIGTLIMGAFLVRAGWKTMEIFEYSSIKFSVAAVFPVVAFILIYLAYRAIVRDEALVRSLDRIR